MSIREPVYKPCRITRIYNPEAAEKGLAFFVDTVELQPDGNEIKGYSFYITSENFGHRLEVGDEIEVFVIQRPRPADSMYMAVKWQGQKWEG